MYDYQEHSSYCSTDCLLASKLFVSQIDDTPIHLRSTLNKLSPDSTNLPPTLTKNISIKEKQETIDSIPQPTPQPSAIEGYNAKFGKPKKKVTFATNDKKQKEDSSSSSEGSDSDDDGDLFIPKFDKDSIPKLSPFGLIYTSLNSWKTRSTLNYLYFGENSIQEQPKQTTDESKQSQEGAEEDVSGLVTPSPLPSTLRREVMTSMIAKQ